MMANEFDTSLFSLGTFFLKILSHSAVLDTYDRHYKHLDQIFSEYSFTVHGWQLYGCVDG